MNIGFILSYVAVLGLVLLCPVFMAPLHRCFQHDPLKLEPDPPWQENLRAVWLMFADMFSVSLAAWLVTAPLTILFFGNFALIGLPRQPAGGTALITGHHHRGSVADTRLMLSLPCRPLQPRQPRPHHPHDRIHPLVRRNPAWLYES